MTRDGDMTVFFRNFYLPAEFPVVALLGSTWSSGNEEVTKLHFHNCMEIGYLYDGNSILYIGEDKMMLEAPCITVIPPNLPHITQGTGDENHWNWIYTDPVQLFQHTSPQFDIALDRYQRTLQGEGCVLKPRDNREVYSLIWLIIHELEYESTKPQKLDENREIIRTMLYSLFQILLRDWDGKSASSLISNHAMASISSALTYINENFSQDISISHLSSLCHLSVSHFRRLFKQVLGYSPQEYLQLVRIQASCALLFNCDNSITEVGMQVGYPTPSSFTKHFKQYYGVSPAQWRRKLRSVDNPQVTAYFNQVTPPDMRLFDMFGRDKASETNNQ